MTTSKWPQRQLSVASLNLDPKNPRLGRAASGKTPRELIQLLFEHDKAAEVAQSIATRGYFPNEPLLVIRENDRHIVVEGNRRLAALKALREPDVLDGAFQRQVERLARRINNIDDLAKVPVIIAPSRRATDRQVAGRHVGTPVLAWQAENRASFILEKLAEGYDNDELLDTLGFTSSDIQSARQTQAIADMARSLDLSEEIREKLENPRAKLLSTVERIFDSTVGRGFLKIEPDPEFGIRGLTTKDEFARGFRKLVSDIALKKESSRSLNSSDDIKKYFESWAPGELPKNKKGSFVPSDLISGKAASQPAKSTEVSKAKKTVRLSTTVLPKDFHIRFGNDRLVDIRRELTRLKRDEFPNAGAVLLRVFLELSVMHYLERIGALEPLVEKLGGKGKLPFGAPSMKQLVPEITRRAKAKLGHTIGGKIEKAIKYDAAAPFTLSDLHSFVHQQSELPGARDIWQFWLRTEPLFRMMLETDDAGGKA